MPFQLVAPHHFNTLNINNDAGNAVLEISKEGTYDAYHFALLRYGFKYVGSKSIALVQSSRDSFIFPCYEKKQYQCYTNSCIDIYNFMYYGQSTMDKFRNESQELVVLFVAHLVI